MNSISDFFGLYSLSKTLRFELKPIGKTLENIEKNGIVTKDIERAESYVNVKKLIDEYHKSFISKTLKGFKFSPGLLEKFEISYKVSDKEELARTTDNMRKEIAATFAKAPEFKRLFAKELIREDLPDFLGDTDERAVVSQFDKFTTYFTGFHENRKNMYSEDEKSSTIAYRLINDNLFKFAENAGAFSRISQSNASKRFKEIESAFSDILEEWSIHDLFRISKYDSFLTQNSIDCYNAIIGGKILDDGTKIQGINELVNLYNQAHKEKSERLPKLKPLYKQILCDRDSLSWLPADFENDRQLLESIEMYFRNLIDCLVGGDSPLAEILQNIETYDIDHIYVRNDTQLTSLSQSVYGDWRNIKKSLEDYYERVSPRREKESEEKFGIRKKSFVDKTRSFSIGFLDSISSGASGNNLVRYYSSIGAQKDDSSDFISAIVSAYKAAEDLLNSDYPENKNLAQNKMNVAKIKELLDRIKDLQHFIKPLYGDGKESDKDERFYGDIDYAFETIDKITVLYNTVRNRMTKKPFSREKVKLNFDNSTLLNGWDINKESDNCGVILRKDGMFYLLILDPNVAREFGRGMNDDGRDCYEKMDYKLLPGAKMLRKVFLSKSRIAEFAPSEELVKHYKEGTHKKGANFSLKDCHNLIDFFKNSIAKHEDWSKFNFEFSDTESYKDLSGFYREFERQGYKITFRRVSESYIKNYVENGKAYLFQIFSKDFSPFSKGTPNLHTIYWNMLFDERNLQNIVYKLNGKAEVFYRKRSLNLDTPTHPAGEHIQNKNPKNNKEISTFDYDIIKDRRYTVDKFQFHVSITMNFQSEGLDNINMSVRKFIQDGKIRHIIGIDRGERNLLYLSVINLNGEIIEQFSLNEIVNEYNGNTYSTDYNHILEKRAGQRSEARQSWQTIETIKELKEGYISQVVHRVSQLMVKYNAIVVLEDLNIGFKRGRQKVEKQVYQKFEKMLIDKLNFFVDKNAPANAPGGALKALQLTNKFKSFQKLGKQSGFLFYVPAWNTSKMDPVTGFVNLFVTRYENVEKAKSFFGKFKSIRFNKEAKYFEFQFDYNDFTEGAKGTRTCWTVCTFGTRIETKRDPAQNNQFISIETDITEEITNLFDEYGVVMDDIKTNIMNVNDKLFFVRLLHLFRLTLQMRNSVPGSDIDYIISPIADKNGKFYDSRLGLSTLPLNADANGAYNIARKGLWITEQLKQAENLSRVNIAISNKEWMAFIQQQT